MKFVMVKDKSKLSVSEYTLYPDIDLDHTELVRDFLRDVWGDYSARRGQVSSIIDAFRNQQVGYDV